MRHSPRFLRLGLPIVCMLLFSFCFGCGGNGTAPKSNDTDEPKGSLRDASPTVLMTSAPGTSVSGTDSIQVDSSNVSDGYLVLIYNGSNEKVKLQLQMPDGVTCTYLVGKTSEPLVYPLSGGDGTYTVSVLESVDIENNLYAIAFTQDIDVTLSSEFVPFLTPNCYVDYQEDSDCVKEGEALSQDCYSDLDVITNIYHYVIEHISYDDEKAKNVAYGYTPDPDETLASGKGICFDYASLMTSMLRSQRIPTKLEVGYSGDVYHAWISCYVEEAGWVDNVIQFDGHSWSLMDPTLAANNAASDVKSYIGDGSNYVVKYTY